MSSSCHCGFNISLPSIVGLNGNGIQLIDVQFAHTSYILGRAIASITKLFSGTSLALPHLPKNGPLGMIGQGTLPCFEHPYMDMVWLL
jgi:hypothetical protein